ncbi:sensor histidine kinase [Cronobacter dublinensis]|uniref:sensor histidine kinase n=1 Tax=Cronobacter dublinensis TaxID=413497 RepID=UPI000CFF52DC|nr:ATP-binding protein [Cronobacter dublinensis]
MKNHAYQSLWRWLCGRIIALALGTVIVIAVCMWLRFAVQNYWIMHRMPPALREEFLRLADNPQLDPARFHDIVDAWWGLEYSTPSIASSDWILLGVLVLVMIPFIIFMGLKYARPLSVQFSRLRDVAEDVTQGEFGRQAELVENAPEEMVRFASDFNAMTRQLARYEKELRASHVAMAHELRSPLTAAMGRLQGMLDGVFTPDAQQLTMVMRQLQLLNRLTDELHLLSLADAGQLTLDHKAICLNELLRERAAWLKPQADAAGIRVVIHAASPAPLWADSLRLGQVFTVLMENTLRYGKPGGRLDIRLHGTQAGYRIAFHDDGPGVDPGFLPVMFERFTRAETSRARHSGGSGLGLSIARAICAAHGGDIQASLPSEGGLLMTVTLPATSDTAENCHP